MDWFFLFIIVVLGLAGFAADRVRKWYEEQQQKLREAENRYREVVSFLNLFARHMATVTKIHDVFALVAQYIKDILRAEAVGIYLVEQNDATPAAPPHLRGTACVGLFPPLQGNVPPKLFSKPEYLEAHFLKERPRFGEGIVGRVAKIQKPLLYPGDDPESPAVPGVELPSHIRTFMAVPMLVDNRITGVICAVNRKREGAGAFTEADLRLFEDLSFPAAMASNLVHVYERRSREERWIQEVSFTRKLQSSLLPKKAPEWGDFDIHATSRSAREVGGDFYDFVPIDDHRLMLVSADASGKGLPASLLMAMSQSFVRACAQHYTTLQAFLHELDQFLYQDTDRSHFVTMAVVVIDRESCVCEYARAGHTELLLQTPEGAVRTINPQGPALGLLPRDLPVIFDTLSFVFRPGTRLLLFTDGITECLNSRDKEFALERLIQVWRQTRDKSVEETARAITEATDRFRGEKEQSDDQTLVILARSGASPETGEAGIGIP